jgi:hypothetical protein
MKRNVKCICTVLALCLLFSFTGCVTKPYMPLSKVPDAQELGIINAQFESRDKLGVGVVGVLGITAAAFGGYTMGTGLGPSGSGKQVGVGALIAAGGFGLGALQDFVINAPKRKRLFLAAQEALLTAARQEYSEEVDVREIRVRYVQRSGRNHIYEATGIVVENEIFF